MLERRVHPGNSEHSQNSLEKQAVEEMEHVKVTMSVRECQCSAGDSDFSKHSQNSLSKVNQKWTQERQRCLLVIVMVSV